MKKLFGSKMTGIVMATVVAASLVTAGTFAWFSAQAEDVGTGVVVAGEMAIAMEYELDATDIWPGDPAVEATVNKVTSTNSRDVVVRVTYTPEVVILVDGALTTVALNPDYVNVTPFVKPATGAYSTDANVIYIKIPANTSVDLGGSVTLLGAAPNNYMNAKITVAPEALATQISEAAIMETFGVDQATAAAILTAIS